MANKQLEENLAKSIAALEDAVAMVKSHVSGYTKKDGTFVNEHDDGRVAAGGYVAPKEGEVGHHEHKTYGKYFRKGDKVKDNYGKTHEVMEHRGAQVTTSKGENFHPTKLHHA